MLAATEPSHLVLFDVLNNARDGDVRRRQLLERRKVLADLMRRIPGTSPLPCRRRRWTPEVAQAWYDGMAVVGVEEPVIKPATGLYSPGSRSGWDRNGSNRTVGSAPVEGHVDGRYAVLVGASVGVHVDPPQKH